MQVQLGCDGRRAAAVLQPREQRRRQALTAALGHVVEWCEAPARQLRERLAPVEEDELCQVIVGEGDALTAGLQAKGEARPAQRALGFDGRDGRPDRRAAPGRPAAASRGARGPRGR